MSRDRARRAKYVVYQCDDGSWQYIGAEIKKRPKDALLLDSLDGEPDIYLSPSRKGHVLIYEHNGERVIGYNSSESRVYAIREIATSVDGAIVPDEAINHNTPLTPPARGKGLLLKQQSDTAFILIRLSDTEENERALYIGTDSYTALEDRWPQAGEWRTVNGVTFFQTESYAPEIRVRHDSPLDFLSPIRLLENTEYYWAILVKRRPEEGALIKESKETADGDVQLGRNGKKIHSGKGHTGYLNFDNYLGSASIYHADIKIATVESTSPKIDYEDEYLRMLDDLTNEALDLILNPASATTSHLDPNPNRTAKDIFGRYLLMKAALPLRRLKSSLGTIKARPHTVLESHEKWLQASVSNGRYAMQDPIGRIRWLRLPNGVLTPHSSLERQRAEITDTPPNRFSRHALDDFAKLCDAIASREGRFGLKHATEARAYADECKRQLRSEPLSSCSRINRVPFDSQVLQKRQGYREIFHAWTKSNLGIKIKELAEGQSLSPDAENRDAPKLYELWLISHLRNALHGLTEDKSAAPLYRNLPIIVDGYYELYPSGGGTGVTEEPIHIVKDALGNLVALYYNRTFSKTLPGVYSTGKFKGNVDKNESYTVPLKPDYTVEIIWAPNGASSFDRVTDLKTYIALARESAPNKGGHTTYVHFDAKFKISNIRGLSQGDDERPSVDDICKMHTYNEAIYGTAASAILYPGTGATAYAKFTDLIPGIAALAVKPDRVDAGARQLLRENAENQICKFLRDIIGLAADKSWTAESKVEDDGSKDGAVYNRLRRVEIEGLKALSKKQRSG